MARSGAVQGGGELVKRGGAMALKYLSSGRFQHISRQFDLHVVGKVEIQGLNGGREEQAVYTG